VTTEHIECPAEEEGENSSMQNSPFGVELSDRHFALRTYTENQHRKVGKSLIFSSLEQIE
jgi:hypothetical protein